MGEGHENSLVIKEEDAHASSSSRVEEFAVENTPLLPSRLPQSYRQPGHTELLKKEKLGLTFWELMTLLVGGLGAIGIGLTPLAFYYFFGQLIGEMQTTNTDVFQKQKEKIQDTSYLFFLIAAVAGVCAILQNFCFIYIGEKVSARIRRELFKSITMQEIGFFDQNSTGDLIAKLSEDTQQIRDAFSDRASQIFMSLAQFTGGLGFAIYYSWQLTLVMMACAPIMGVVIVTQGAFLIRFTKRSGGEKASSSSGEAVAVAEEVISSFRTVRAFSQEEKENDRFAAKIANIIETARKRAAAQGIGVGMIQFVVWGACGVAFWFGGYLIGESSSDFNFGDLVTVFGMMLFASLGLAQGFSAVPEISKGRASFIRVREIIYRTPLIPFSEGNTLSGMKGEIAFSSVSFSYPQRDIEVLQNISFEVPCGRTVAFVGESGSGKSTIFALLERFYEAQKGAVLIDGVDIRTLDPRWLHSHMAIVSQEPVLFATTIAENIAYARFGVSRAEIVAAAKAANAHDFIMRLPKKYKTLVGERGSQLSGGQKQRIAIARAVLADPRILLLDEATSALDTESEKLVQDALDRLMIGKTSLVIAHRLSTVINADRLFVLVKGQIVSSGTHSHLRENSEEYRNLYNRQFADSSLFD